MGEYHTFTTNVQWTVQRKAVLSSPSLPPIEVGSPSYFPGGHEGIWSPEHLYTASAEICLLNTFLLLAEKTRFPFIGYKSEAEGTMETTENGLLMTKILIKPKVVVASPELQKKALSLLEKAEKFCLISNSMKTTVTIEPAIVVQMHA